MIIFLSFYVLVSCHCSIVNSFEVIAKNLVGQENFTNATVVTMNVALTGAKVSTVISITVNNLRGCFNCCHNYNK